MPLYAAVLVAGWYMVRKRVYGISKGDLKFDEDQNLVSTSGAVHVKEIEIHSELREAQ
ncbi:hypothetical protein D3C81_2098640 [compost metagenome]